MESWIGQPHAIHLTITTQNLMKEEMVQLEPNVASPLRGETHASKALDLFVIVHSICAAAFASIMCFSPSLFSVFVNDADDFGDLASDSVRWACGFVYGFAMFAAASLWMPPQTRIVMARVFCASFAIATCNGVYVQSTGRWNSYHPINIALFGCLGLVYAIFSTCFPKAFVRTHKFAAQ